MRVISGTARGLYLIAPKGLKIRPTGDRMKEDLFNILTPLLQKAVFLDMYCGSGAIGIEALSRGAKAAIFVDTSKEAIAATEANLLKARLEDRSEILHMSANQALQKLQSQNRVFDIIFMDPPYDSEELSASLDFMAKRDFLAEDGIIVIESPMDVRLPDCFEIPEISIYRQKQYTQMQFVFYKKIGKERP